MELQSGEVDIAHESRFTCTFQQAKQRRAFCRTRPASDDDNDAAVSLSRRKLDEVVAVTGDQQAILLMSECKDERVCDLLREYIAQPQELVAEFLGVGRSGPRVHHGRAGTSRLLVRHLSRHQQINFSPMILVVGKTLVDLSPGERRKTRRREGLNGFAVLQKTDDIVDGNPRAFHSRIPAAYVGRSNNVSIGFRQLAHESMVRGLNVRINRECGRGRPARPAA
jgi:hypothetical protein